MQWKLGQDLARENTWHDDDDDDDDAGLTLKQLVLFLKHHLRRGK